MTVVGPACALVEFSHDVNGVASIPSHDATRGVLCVHAGIPSVECRVC